jgi:hypothetical protein
MRISALSSALLIGVVGALTHSAHADRKKPLVATHELAALLDPALTPRPGAGLSTGELGLTAARAPAHADGAADGTLAAIVVPGPALRERPERYLTTSDVATIVGDRAADIERCYLGAMGATRRGGKLDVMFTIARNGSVLSVDTAAPDLPVVAAHHMHTCIRTAVEGLAFPARRNDTTAIVPYYFQRTEAPNSGPQLSCWNPRGC